MFSSDILGDLVRELHGRAQKAELELGTARQVLEQLRQDNLVLVERIEQLRYRLAELEQTSKVGGAR